MLIQEATPAELAAELLAREDHLAIVISIDPNAPSAACPILTVQASPRISANGRWFEETLHRAADIALRQ